MEQKAHPFSYTLGPGPYRMVDFFGLVLPSEANQGRNNFHLAPKGLKSGCGTCAHCGHGIINNYIVQNGLGERFAIGSECVEKCGNDGQFENMSTFEKHQRELKRKQGQERREKQRQSLEQECKQLVSENNERLGSIRRAGYVGQSDTWANYSSWYLARRRSLGALKIFKSNLLKALNGVSK